jgi:hypothetical protein
MDGASLYVEGRRRFPTGLLYFTSRLIKKRNYSNGEHIGKWLVLVLRFHFDGSNRATMPRMNLDLSAIRLLKSPCLDRNNVKGQVSTYLGL